MMPRLRIVDLAALVALAAAGSLLGRDPALQYDFTFLACPVAVSATLVMLVAATIKARFGSERHRAFSWGFALVGWTYFVAGLGLGVRCESGAFLPASLVSQAIGEMAERARSSGYTRVGSLAESLCLLPRTGRLILG